MKKVIITFLLPMCAIAALAQTTKKSTTIKKTVPGSSTAKTAAQPAFTNTLDSASYSFGTAMAGSLKNNGLTSINYQLFMKGVQDAFAGQTLRISPENAQAAINNIFKIAGEKKFEANVTEGKSFLENNKKQPGVQVTPSGLQYLVLTKGTGITPKATDTVLVHYKGTLLNGKQFDSSYDRNEPISLPLDGVIKGWTEGMQLMQTGAKYKFFIPYTLAYGERGAGQDIPPYSTLIFEIELLKVNGK